MTKEEIRALTICKGQLRADHIIYDLGAGTGSITIEAALQAPQGHVYAVERHLEGIDLIKENMQRFKVNNVTVIHQEAPEALAELPLADRIFIGGSGGRLAEILAACDGKLKAGGRMVINAITLETLWHSINILEALRGYELSMCCLDLSRIEKVGKSHMLKGLNPIYIISAQKETA